MNVVVSCLLLWVSASASPGEAAPASDLPAAVHEAVFEQGPFAEPIRLTFLPETDDEDVVSGPPCAADAPASVPWTQARRMDQRILRFLLDKRLSRLVLRPCPMPRDGHVVMECMVFDPSIAELREPVARRRLLRLDEVRHAEDDAGPGSARWTARFAYAVDTLTDVLPSLPTEYDGEVGFARDPDSGEWTVESISLSDPGEAIYADWIAAEYDDPSPFFKPAPDPDASPSDAAAHVYATRCAACHGGAGRGDGPASPALTTRPRDYRDAAWQVSITDEQIEAVILDGGSAHGLSPLMPPNPDLALRPDVVRALRSIVRSFAETQD